MILGALDPSYKRTGIAIYKDGKIYIRNRKIEPNSDKSFQQVWKSAVEQSNGIVSEMRRVSEERFNMIISECPPPQGQFSPGLYALDAMLFEKLKDITDGMVVVYPNYIGHVHGKRGYTKTESVELARTLLTRLSEFVEVDMTSKRISHDESEAVIFLCRLFVLNNMFLDELKDVKGLFSEKEKILF